MRKMTTIFVSLLLLAATLGVTAVVWAKKPPQPPPPSGTIYFVYDDGSGSTMWTMNADGSEKTELGVDYCQDSGYKKFGRVSRLKHGDHYWFVRFCPVDGTYPDGTPMYEMFAIRDDGTMGVQLTDDPTLTRDAYGRNPVYSIDDTDIAFPAKRWVEGEEVPVDFGIYSAPIEYDGDGNIIGLSGDPARIWDTGYVQNSKGRYLVNLLTFDWSPDETKIVLGKRDTQLCIANLGTSSEDCLTNGWNPKWSPDGTKIAFSWEQDLRTINPDGTDEQIIVEDSSKGGLWKYVHNNGEWSPDSKYLVYDWFVWHKTGAGEGNYYVYIVEADGDHPRSLTNDLPAGNWKLSHAWR